MACFKACLPVGGSLAEFATFDPSEHPAWREWQAHPALRQYTVMEELGSGAFSKVMLAMTRPRGCFTSSAQARQVALKIVFLGNPRLNAENKAVLKAECDILEELRHPHIVDVRRTHMWDTRQMLIIEEEWLQGRELLDEVKVAVKQSGFAVSESWARAIMRQVLQALKYMHARGVLHRDLKQDNLRFQHPASEWTRDPRKLVIKVIDFGLSCKVKPGAAPETGMLGTRGFIAPEVIKMQAHTPAMDMYAVGVILFRLLVGSKPMTERESDDLLYADTPASEHSNMQGNEAWDALSSKCQDLIYRLLELRPGQRITAAQALEHPWMQSSTEREQLRARDLKSGNSLSQMRNVVSERHREVWRKATNTIVRINRIIKAMHQETVHSLQQSNSVPDLPSTTAGQPDAPTRVPPLRHSRSYSHLADQDQASCTRPVHRRAWARDDSTAAGSAESAGSAGPAEPAVSASYQDTPHLPSIDHCLARSTVFGPPGYSPPAAPAASTAFPSAQAGLRPASAEHIAADLDSVHAAVTGPSAPAPTCPQVPATGRHGSRGPSRTAGAQRARCPGVESPTCVSPSKSPSQPPAALNAPCVGPPATPAAARRPVQATPAGPAHLVGPLSARLDTAAPPSGAAPASGAGAGSEAAPGACAEAVEASRGTSAASPLRHEHALRSVSVTRGVTEAAGSTGAVKQVRRVGVTARDLRPLQSSRHEHRTPAAHMAAAAVQQEDLANKEIEEAVCQRVSQRAELLGRVRGAP